MQAMDPIATVMALLKGMPPSWIISDRAVLVLLYPVSYAVDFLTLNSPDINEKPPQM